MTYIEREALLKEANQDGAYGYVDTCQIAQIPAADVVPVVRCKECKHLYGPYDNGPDGELAYFCHYWTDQYDQQTELDGFCHAGEKRED